MNQRPLGNTGIRVSEIAFGGVEIGLPYGIGVQSEADMLSESEAIRLLHAAIDSGVNFFDTARMYGASEAIMGKAFRDRRDRVVICTKCRHFRDSQGGLADSDALKKIIETSLHESLSALQSDFVDVYMLHQADREILEHEDIAETFQNLKARGLIRATGVSTYKVEETQKAIDSGAWDVLQVPFNLMDQSQSEMFPLAARRGVGIVVRSVLFKGILSEKGRNLHPALKDVEAHLKLYEELLGDSLPDLPTLATKFALSFNQVSSVLVGIDRMEYLQKALTAADGDYLDEKTLARARELRYPEPEFLNLVKWDRMGWLS
ncbi:MAG: aldo/keto reductase [Calditrichaeota bacterium]|nr:aldo/keto reductase [Calditrichota bacterium]